MGSTSDWSTMSKAVEVLTEFGVPHEAQVLSAHRMPDEMFAFAEAAADRGLRAIIAGAGGAAHLPGHARREDHRAGARRAGAQPPPGGPGQPVLIVQMPAGVPVATFAIGEAGATNAALFAVALLAADDAALADDSSPSTGPRRHHDAATSTLPPA